MSELANKLRELLIETEKEKMSGAGVILTLSELTAILAALEDAEELHTMQLAAICVASLSNSRNSAPPIEITNPYWTPAYDSVVAAVTREIACRERAEEAERKLADAEKARDEYKDMRDCYLELRQRLQITGSVWKELESRLADAHDAARRECAGICADLPTRSDKPTGDFEAGYECGCQDSEEVILARLGQPVEGQS